MDIIGKIWFAKCSSCSFYWHTICVYRLTELEAHYTQARYNVIIHHKRTITKYKIEIQILLFTKLLLICVATCKLYYLFKLPKRKHNATDCLIVLPYFCKFIPLLWQTGYYTLETNNLFRRDVERDRDRKETPMQIESVRIEIDNIGRSCNQINNVITKPSCPSYTNLVFINGNETISYVHQIILCVCWLFVSKSPMVDNK